MTDLLDLAIKGHGGQRRWEQIERFRVATSITGAIWTLKSQPGLLDDVVLAGDTQRLAAGHTSRAGGRASRDQGAGQGVPRARPSAAGAIVDTTHGPRRGLARRGTAR